MKQQIEINSLQDLFNWIDSSKRCYVVEKYDDCFTIQAPNNATWQIQFDKNDEIDDIISKTIEQLEDFDADERFTDFWSREFAERNGFRPSQFIRMLQEDEASFEELAMELRFHFLSNPTIRPISIL